MSAKSPRHSLSHPRGDPGFRTVDRFAQDHEVILFNNAGVASSSGEVPTTFAEMAKSAGVFVDALGPAKVDCHLDEDNPENALR